MTISFQTITPHGIAADDAAACQHRCKVGRADIAYRRHARQCTMSIRPSDASVHVVVALAGQAVVVGKARTFAPPASGRTVRGRCGSTYPAPQFRRKRRSSWRGPAASR